MGWRKNTHQETGIPSVIQNWTWALSHLCHNGHYLGLIVPESLEKINQFKSNRLNGRWSTSAPPPPHLKSLSIIETISIPSFDYVVETFYCLLFWVGLEIILYYKLKLA
jgi:hypothetical protein